LRRAKANNLDEAIDRMNEADDETEELCDRITELEAETIEGLRVKALGVLFRAKPICASDLAGWDWPDDIGSTYSLFYDVAKLTGLLPMVEHYEAKFEKIAAEIEAAGGDGSVKEQVAQEPLPPQTSEEKAATCRDMIDYFTIRLREIEAEIAAAGAVS
jgi:hypothetical protein